MQPRSHEHTQTQPHTRSHTQSPAAAAEVGVGAAYTPPPPSLAATALRGVAGGAVANEESGCRGGGTCRVCHAALAPALALVAPPSAHCFGDGNLQAGDALLHKCTQRVKGLGE